MLRASLLIVLVANSAALFNGGVTKVKTPVPKGVGGRKAVGSGRVVPSARGRASAALVVENDGVDLEKITQVASDLTTTGLRLATCALMVHHGIDKLDVRSMPALCRTCTLLICAVRVTLTVLLLCLFRCFPSAQHVDGFTANVVAKFFGFLPGDPKFWTYSAAATQIAGAGLLGIGLFSRPTAAAMTGTMIAAVAFHLLNTGPEGFPLGVPSQHSYNFELAAMYVGTLLYFTANGAGKYSVDEQVLGGELDFYSRVFDKVKGEASD